MKKLLLFAFIIVASVFSIHAQCTPDVALITPGLYPQPMSFACAEQGVSYSGAVITIKNFNTAGPGGAYTIDSVFIDSVTNVPCGLIYSVYYPNGRCLRNSESGCINFTGITTDPAGQYKVKIYAKVYGGLPTGIEGVSTDLAALGALNTPPLDYRYWIRVKPAGGSCTALDTAVSSMVNKISSCHSSYTTIANLNPSLSAIQLFPNPAQSTTNLSFTANEAAVYDLSITNIIGELIDTKTLQVAAGENSYNLNLSGYAKGNYIAVLKQNGLSTSLRFVVQ
jgi:hypothetical protein